MRFPIVGIPFLALTAGAAPAFALDSPVEIHGFASQGWLYSQGNAMLSSNSDQGGSFDFNEFGVNFTATPLKGLRIGAQLFAYTLGKYGKDRVELDWGYGEYQVPTGSDHCEFTVEAGRIKTSYGFYNDYRDLDLTRTQVFLPMPVYLPTFRDIFVAINGAGFTATGHTAVLGSFILTGYVGGQNVDPQGSVGDAFNNPAAGIQVQNTTVKRSDGGSLTWETPVDGLRLKGSLFHTNRFQADASASAGGTTVPVTIVLTNYYAGIAGIEYQEGPLTLVSEYNSGYGRVETDTSALVPGSGTNLSYLRQQGAYASVSWRFLDRWEVLAGGQWLDNQEVHDPVAGFTRGAVVAVRCDVADHWLVKAEFQRNRGTAMLTNTGVAPGSIEEYWNLMALKTSFDF